MPNVGGAFVYYTTDGVTWQRLNLTIQGTPATSATSATYTGAIPGMPLGAVVRFVFGAQDSAGNVVYMDINKNLYTNFTLIPASSYLVYTVTMNWVIFFIFVAIAAVIFIVGYVAYMRRGGYWERMRRSASTKATAISVEAKFTALYYFLAEKFNNLGISLRKTGRKAGDRLEGFWDWAGNKLGDRWRNFWGGVVDTISNFLKGIGNAIGGIFTGLGDFITGVRWYQILIIVMFGLLLVLFPLVSVFTVGSTAQLANMPLRDTFFVGMGLVLFIAGFVVAIMNLIYQISYK
jgi:ABC-type multidrug transport system fused ATPase/permease subunit